MQDSGRPPEQETVGPINGTHGPSDEALAELSSKAGVGALWTISGYGGRQVIRLGSNLVLTRLLVPEHFGLMFVISGVLIGLELFSDIGIGQAVIQNKRSDAGFVNTAWTMSIVRGFVLWSIACAITPVLANVYDDPLLLEVLPIASFVAVFEGFLSTKIFTENRALNMKRIIGVELTAQILGVAVMITWALISPTVWALVAGNVCVAIMLTTLSHLVLPGISNRLHFERAAARELLSFGIWITLSSGVMYAADYMDRFLFRAFVGNAEVGVYSIGVTLASVPSQAMTHVTHSIIFPLYSRLLEGGVELTEKFKRVRAPLFTLGGWATAGLIAGGPTIVRLLYDPRYWEAGWMLQAISAGMWFGVLLSGTNTAAVLALGESRWTALISIGRLVGIAVCVPLGWQLAGFRGMIFGYAASEVFRYLVSVFAARWFYLRAQRQDVAVTLIVAIAAAAGWGVVWLLDWLGLGDAIGGYITGRAAIIVENIVNAIAIFVTVSAVWWPWLGKLIRDLRRGERLFG